MSTHADNFAAAGLPLLFEQHADAGRVTWTPRGESPAAVAAIVGQETQTESHEASGRRRTVRRRLTITTDSGGDYPGVPTPQITASVTVDGVAYAVESIKPRTAAAFDAIVVRYDQLEVSRGNYRQPHYGNPTSL